MPLYVPPKCPACPKGHGVATIVSVAHQQKTVSYQCDSCPHTWQVTIPADDFAEAR